MNELTVVVADDDLSSRTILKHFIDFLPGYQFINEAVDGDELVELLLKEKPDIALVDINMPGLNGVEAVKLCKKFFPAMQVIFTTGYDNFAVDAFNISAIDYIIKPIERTRLFLALEKAKQSLDLFNHTPQNTLQKQSSRLSIKSYNTLLYLIIDDIIYIEKEARKTMLHTTHNCFETTESLQELEGKLPDYFFKTHRSFLVNLKKISRIEPSGETYLAFFSQIETPAHISKLKIQEVQSLITK
jgi:two-component system, LytTR family, response regulator